MENMEDKTMKPNDIIDTSDILEALFYFTTFLIIGYIVITVVIYRPIDKASNERTVTATITDKPVKTKRNNSSKYLIFTKDEDGEIQVFEISDSLWKGRFDSSDLYGALETDKTYQFTVCGHRNEFHSWYPNIYEAVEQK